MNTLQEETEQPCVTAAMLSLCPKPSHRSRVPHTCADDEGCSSGTWDGFPGLSPQLVRKGPVMTTTQQLMCPGAFVLRGSCFC